MPETSGVAVAHRVLLWQSRWRVRAPEGPCLLASHWRAAWVRALAFFRGRQGFCGLCWKMKEL